MASPDERSPAALDAPAASIFLRKPPPGRPTLYVPYLFGIGLAGLGYGAATFVTFDDHVFLGVVLFVVFFWGLHTAWCTLLFRDAANEIGEGLPIGPVRAMILNLLTCFFFCLWTAVALRVLVRAALSALGESPRGAHAALLRVHERSGGVILAILMTIVADLFVMNQVEARAELRGGDAGFAVVDLLGPEYAGLLAFLRVATAFYYLQFVRRLVRALYGAWPEIREARARGRAS